MSTLTQLVNKMSGKAFREALNSNFASINSAVVVLESKVNNLPTNIDKKINDLSTKDNELSAKIDDVVSDVTDITTKLNQLESGYSKIFVSSVNGDNGTIKLPADENSSDITIVGQDVFEQETDTLNTAIKNIIKGDYIKAGENITLEKNDAGVTISAKSSASVNEDWQHSNPNLLMNSDWRHPSSHRNRLTFIKIDDTTETKAKHCIDCWEINYPNRSGSGYTFYDAEEDKYVAYQGVSPTDPTNLDMYATLSQSFPDNWGDFLIGKKLNLSIAVSTSYSDYQSGIYDIYSYSFTASQGYTGWMAFPNLPSVEFGIHFNTLLGEEPNQRIENEITIRFDNIWVYALKLEIGETPTLKYDLMQPVDYYKQARDCEKYIQSSVSDGTTIMESIEDYSNMTQFINDNLVFSFPVSIPFMKQPSVELYGVSGLSTPVGDSFEILVNGTTYSPTDPLELSIVKYNPGSKNIYIQTNITKQQLMTAVGVTELSGIYSLTIVSNSNIILSCEETYSS